MQYGNGGFKTIEDAVTDAKATLVNVDDFVILKRGPLPFPNYNNAFPFWWYWRTDGTLPDHVKDYVVEHQQMKESGGYLFPEIISVKRRGIVGVIGRMFNRSWGWEDYNLSEALKKRAKETSDIVRENLKNGAYDNQSEE